VYHQLKPRTISIKLAQEDYLLIVRQASALGMNPTEFVRRFTVQSAKILEQGGFPND
jgi:uncharacterized protein (DUF1778 family)